MDTKIAAIGINYKNTPIENRELFAVSDQQIPEALQVLRSRCQLEELVILSTCNRVELYFVTENPLKTYPFLINQFLSWLEIDRELGESFQFLLGKECIRHLFRVACSLESMVIGEPQILGQVKEAFRMSEEQGSCRQLKRLFHTAFQTAKQVKQNTTISRFAVSVSYAAVELAKKIFARLEKKTVLIIGTGEMAELATSHLVKAGCSRVLVTNRTFSRAVELAEKFQGAAIHYDALSQHLEAVDIVISSTGAKNFLITPEIMDNTMRQRRFRPMFLIDIAVPRDIDPKTNELGNVYVYDIDDLQSVVSTNLKERKKEAEKAQEYVDEAVNEFEAWMKRLEVVPVIKALRNHISSLAQTELKKGLKRGRFSEEQKNQIEMIFYSLTNKLLHTPTLFLRNLPTGHEDTIEYIDLLLKMFDLDFVSNEDQTRSSKVIKMS